MATIWGPASRSAAASSRHLYLVKHWLAFTLGSRRPGDAYTWDANVHLKWDDPRDPLGDNRHAVAMHLTNVCAGQVGLTVFSGFRFRVQRPPPDQYSRRVDDGSGSDPACHAQDRRGSYSSTVQVRSLLPLMSLAHQHLSLAALWAENLTCSGSKGCPDWPRTACLLKVLGGVQAVWRLLRL